MKEYNMEASTERSAGRFQIVSETSIGSQWAEAGAACSPSEVEQRKQRIWERPAQATREAALNQRSVRGSIVVSQGSQGSKGIIGIDRGSLVLDRCSRRCRLMMDLFAMPQY
jgi:hypothetical protein